jgi:RNA polymerase sigma-70 factor (ECF subfamily)
MERGRSGSDDDIRLVRAVAAGSQDALAALYDRHADAVFAAASRLTSDRQVAEEVVQETFLALWNRAELFDPGAGSLSAWLHTIARNRTVDRLRAAGRRPNLVALSATAGQDEPETAALERLTASGRVLGGADVGPGPEAALQAAELREVLRGALAGMPEAERTVIVLAYQDDLTQAEIAGRLGWPLGTVKTRTRRALLRLREALRGGTDERPAVRLAAVPARGDDDELDDHGPR